MSSAPGTRRAVGARVLIVDPSTIYRAGLCHEIEQTRGFEVVGEAGTAAEALALFEASAPTLVMIDVELPDVNGIEVCRQLVTQQSRLRVVTMSYWDWDIYLAGSFDAGAVGFVPKRALSSQLGPTLRRAARGPTFTPEQLARIQRWEKEVADPLRLLGAREWSVLWLLAAGISTRDVAGALVVSESTVGAHVNSLLRKLGLPSRTALVAFIMQHHLDALAAVEDPTRIIGETHAKSRPRGRS